MAVQRHVTVSGRFEHILVMWKVINFSFSDERAYTLRSSTFTINASVPSSWYLGLEWQPPLKINNKTPEPEYPDERPDATVHLIRKLHDKQGSKKDIRSSVRFGSIDGMGISYWFKEAFNGYLSTGCVLSLSSGISLFRSGSNFTVMCELIVYNDKDSWDYFPCSPDTARALRAPMYRTKFQREANFNDLILELHDGQLKANKSILCDRCPVLRKMIEESKDNRISLEYADEVAMEQVIFYLYFNNLDYISENYLSLNLFRIAEKLDIEDLVSLISPREVHMNSEAGGVGHRHKWKVSQFSQLLPKTYAVSSTAGIDFPFEMKFYLKVCHNQEKIGIFLQLLKGRPEFDVNVMISLVNAQGHESHLKCYSGSHYDGKFVGAINHVMKVEDFESQLLPRDSITIVSRVSYTDLKFKNSIDKTISVGETIMGNTTENDLVQKMGSLREEDKDNEVTVKCGDNKRFLVHKSVLRNRSTSFYRQLSIPSSQKPAVLKMPDIPKDIMKLILQYIYTGRLTLRDFDTALRVYEVTFRFDVDLLREICASYFKMNLSVSRISNLCTIYQRTHELKDTDLKSYVRRYACSHANEILLLDEWKEFSYRNRDLLFEVIRDLHEAFSNSMGART